MRWLRRQSLSIIPPPAPAQERLVEPVECDSGCALEVRLDILIRAAVQYTGASGVAVALLDGALLVCRARLGSTAPEFGVALNIGSGITGACVRTAKVLKCDDTERDERVDAEVCRSLGIRSIVAIPILVNGVVTGLLEVLSDRPHAFKAVHVHWLQKVAALVHDSPYTVTPERAEQSKVLAEVTAKHDCLSAESASPAFIPNDTSNACAESAGMAAFRGVLDKTAESSSWDDICEQLVVQLQK